MRLPFEVDPDVVSRSSAGDPLTTALALAALAVSILAVLVPAATGWQQRRRDDRATRAVMYLELIELVERHGLWVVDRTHDLVETSHEDFEVSMPHRRTERPDRTLRVRARAIVSAYASASVARAYAAWQGALEAFEAKLDDFSFTADLNGPHDVDAREAEPLRDLEVTARGALADAVNRQLVTERRVRRSSD